MREIPRLKKALNLNVELVAPSDFIHCRQAGRIEPLRLYRSRASDGCVCQSSESKPRLRTVADPLDEYSENVAGLLGQARDLLSEAERIFATETTAEHRSQWSNVYRLESATKHAQDVLTLGNPRIVLKNAAEEIVAAATQARDVIREAVTSGGGNLEDAAERLLNATKQIEVGLGPPDLPGLRELGAEVEQTRDEIKTQISEAGAEVAGQKDQAFAAISNAVDAINTQRETAEQQASELGLTTSAIAAENLADAYGEVARNTEEQAERYTRGALAIYLFSILVAGVGIYTTAQHTSQVETFVARAALGIPFALFGAYINSLASTHRREAWRLRHIELQIRTSNPFLGLLDTGRREETLAALALRFFPGQEGVSFDGKGAWGPTPELFELLRMLLQQQGASAATPMRTPDPPAAA